MLQGRRIDLASGTANRCALSFCPLWKPLTNAGLPIVWGNIAMIPMMHEIRWNFLDQNY
jgi:hypothetical protein